MGALLAGNGGEADAVGASLSPPPPTPISSKPAYVCFLVSRVQLFPGPLSVPADLIAGKGLLRVRAYPCGPSLLHRSLPGVPVPLSF